MLAQPPTMAWRTRGRISRWADFHCRTTSTGVQMLTRTQRRISPAQDFRSRTSSSARGVPSSRQTPTNGRDVIRCAGLGESLSERPVPHPNSDDLISTQRLNLILAHSEQFAVDTFVVLTESGCTPPDLARRRRELRHYPDPFHPPGLQIIPLDVHLTCAVVRVVGYI